MQPQKPPKPPLRRARLPSADRVGVLVRPLYSPAQRARAGVWLPRLLADLAASPGPGDPPDPEHG